MRIRLIVDGLSAYLPQPEGEPDRMHILLPDVREPVERSAPGVTINVCAHRPVLILPDGSTWKLAGEHIEISEGIGGVNIDQSFWDSVSDMEKIAPGSEEMHGHYLNDPPTPPEGRVGLVADLILRAGNFSVAEADLNSFTAFFERPGAAPTSPGRFARFVQIEIEVPGDRATVRTIQFGDGPETHRQDLVPSAGEDSIDLILRNRCNRPDGTGLPDNDFIIYYDLCFDYRGPRRIPYPMPGGIPVTPPGVELSGPAMDGGGCIAGRYKRARHPGQ